MLLTLIIVLGGAGTLAMLLFAMQGPSTSKALKRRIEMVKERHGDVIAANAQAQIRKLFANRSTGGGMEGWRRRSSRSLRCCASGLSRPGVRSRWRST
ncbi:hypothetical protein [Sphingomonas daechungensis]|uniref:hypothetical protein n=1 Tax=Sphingomonas daechungensis TaxID=1176646 RepID=UPI0037D9F263